MLLLVLTFWITSVSRWGNNSLINLEVNFSIVKKIKCINLTNTWGYLNLTKPKLQINGTFSHKLLQYAAGYLLFFWFPARYQAYISAGYLISIKISNRPTNPILCIYNPAINLLACQDPQVSGCLQLLEPQGPCQ